MNIKLVLLFLILFLRAQVNGQHSDALTYWFPADYFSGENAIVSQSVKFHEDYSVNLYKNFTCDSIVGNAQIVKDSLYLAKNSFIEIIPGKVVIKRDTVLICWTPDEKNERSLEISRGDTINYFMYFGEGIYFVGIEDCGAELRNPYSKTMNILSDHTKLTHSLYLEKIKGWIKLEEYKAEIKTKWAKYY